ncbi:hypothetical protein [Algoriphagus resistens]|uniref:hypothetical protein n=1 Tax=Algoriphagus resistens TaxID=1750590 RepID=UPI0007167E56|nr:hypothetical protein [Algoriphagus resistens]
MQNLDSINQVISRVDTLYINRVDPLYNEAYIKLLERSNDQLSLVGNPLAWMIGALGILFTVGAIVTAYLLWRQSKEFKEDQKKLLDSAKNEISQLHENLKDQSDMLLNRLTVSVEEIEQKNKSLDEPEKEILLAKIESLKSDINKIKFNNLDFKTIYSEVSKKEKSTLERFKNEMEKLKQRDKDIFDKISDELKKINGSSQF